MYTNIHTMFYMNLRTIKANYIFAKTDKLIKTKLDVWGK